MSSLSFAFFEVMDFDFLDTAGVGASGSSVGPTSLGDGNPRADSLLAGSGSTSSLSSANACSISGVLSFADLAAIALS